MTLRNSWRRALVAAGLVEDRPRAVPDYLRPPGHAASSSPAAVPPPAAVPGQGTIPHPQDTAPALAAFPSPAWAPTAGVAGQPTAGYREDDAERIVVRRLGPALAVAVGPPPADEIEEIFAEQQPAADDQDAPTDTPPAAIADRPADAPGAPQQPVAVRTGAASPPAVATPPAPPRRREVSVHRVAPSSFNEAQHVADRFKAATPVVLDLQGVESELAKRLIAFASGLTYGLDGGMERVDDRVFLLTPRAVEIPEAQRERLARQGSLNRI